MPAENLRIPAAERAHMDAVRELFREYQVSLGIDLCFQGFEQELAGLPGKYAPPRGALLVAQVDAQSVGCVGLRPLDERIAEMKRLYVRPAHRATGAGRALAQAIVAQGRALGVASMRLDTLATMTAAIGLYRSLGFVEIAPYYDNPLPDAIYLELRLS